MSESVITERGQISIPAKLRKQLNLQPGQKMHWEMVSEGELRLTRSDTKALGPHAVLGIGRHHGMSTDEWMKILREGEED